MDHFSLIFEYSDDGLQEAMTMSKLFKFRIYQIDKIELYTPAFEEKNYGYICKCSGLGAIIRYFRKKCGYTETIRVNGEKIYQRHK